MLCFVSPRCVSRRGEVRLQPTAVGVSTSSALGLLPTVHSGTSSSINASVSSEFIPFENSGNTGHADTAGESTSRRGGVSPNPVTLSTWPGAGQLPLEDSLCGINSDLFVQNVYNGLSINARSIDLGPSNNNPSLVISVLVSPADHPVRINDEEVATSRFDLPCFLGRRGKVQVQPSTEM